ncbi:MAG: FG-GAP-like repeat-containing protein [Acidobacteriia bacterium]|nr:FG-GAP-like repeat-containing protein [Terriglobia bacterium]
MKTLAWVAGLSVSAAAVLVFLPRGVGQTTEQDLWRHRNLGKALYETPTSIAEAPAELKKALELAPDSFRDRLNYGLALLRAGDNKGAVAELEKVQKQNPTLPHTWFNLGIAYKRMGRNADAMRQFERMIQIVPDEPVSHYNLGLLYNLADRGADALVQFRTAARLDPNFVAPRFQIYTYYRLSGEEAEAARALADFQQVKSRQQEMDEKEDVEWCPYAELYDPVQALPAPHPATPAAAVRFEDRKLAGSADSKTAGLLFLDSDSDGAPDLLAWSRLGLLLYRHGTDLLPDSGLAGLQDVVSAAVGDFDNDGFPDLCVLTEGGARLFHNVRGRFQETGVKLPPGRFQKAVWLDYDHDYDLDLFLLGASSKLLRNRGDGTFEDYTAHFPFADGAAVDAAAFRVVPDTKGMDLVVSYADRTGVLYRDGLRGAFLPQPIAVHPNATLAPVDVDNDSWVDLAFSTARGVFLAMNRQGKFVGAATRGSGAFVFADLEDRGFVDLVARNGVLRNQGLAQFAAAVQPAGLIPFSAVAQADFDGDGKPDLAVVAPDGSIHLLANRTATKNNWLRVALTGVKNLKTAPGSEIEIKAGDHYQKAGYDGAPLLFGLGPYKQADTIRITWPNGLIQNQPNEAAGRAVPVKEAPRLAGSCPMVFTWNGRGFQFITDVLGVAPLGASASDGQFFPVDHDEYVRIAAGALVPEQGQYRVRVTEELHEVTYLDQARLIAVDHPSDVEIFSNEKFKSPPFPEFRLFGVRRRIYPVAAHEGRGNDVLPSILRHDGVYASGFGHDYAGVAETHSLTLDFGPRAARDNRAALLLEGWVDWADGSTFLGASQRAGGGLVFPYVQVKDEAGQWRTVVEDMGIPSGKPKTIAVDLSGKFLSASREVRIVTNLCVYWDEIFLSEDTAAPPARMTPVDAESATLRLRGFSRTVIDPRREQPEAFNYARWTPSVMWNQTPGLYTRYGDVRELALAPDDRFVVMGSGDELQLSYPASGLPALPEGWQRDFLLLIDGWAKDSDANTAFSQTVEPLPFHAMSGYPYPASERYPDDEAHRAYRRTYNTRPAIRFIPRLLSGR